MRRFLFLATLLFLLPAGAFGRSWEIQDFEVDILVYRDGAIRVEERLALRFEGSFNGITRSIPVRYTEQLGTTYRLRLKLQEVTDEAGRPLKVEPSEKGGYKHFKIWIPGAQDTVRTIALRYQVDNAIRSFPDHDELYWNATGTEWPVPIKRASSVVRLPPETSGGLRAIAYTGPFGARGTDYTMELSGNTATFASTRPFGYREGLTIVVGWPKGIVTEPSWLTKAWWTLTGNPLLALPLFIFALMGLLWYTGGRDPKPSRSVMPLFEPPEGLRPAEVGTLADHTMDPRDLSATLVDLAIKGYLKIEELEGSYAFRRLKGPEAWGELRLYERMLLEGIFGEHGDYVPLDFLKNRFYQHLPELKEGIYQELKSRRYFVLRPDRVRGFYQGIASLLLVIGFAPVIGYASAKGLSPFLAVGALLVSVGIIFAFARIMPARTKAGVETYLKVLGLEEYLARAEKDRMRLIRDPSAFEKLLPYAMALGVEQNWARAFTGIVTEPPKWYEGTSGRFNTMSFSRQLNGMSRSVWTTMSASPRASSSSSGFGGGGGGGSSGGGFGGGGGSAF
ncbi:MAG: DUF2207 domain-containing protein [candidate division NC10 bacterium]|nr:DUF2207 domain-containing protein [candidate division NC10 bacterium]